MPSVSLGREHRHCRLLDGKEEADLCRASAAVSEVQRWDSAISGDSPALLVTLIVVINMAVGAESHGLFLASRPSPHGSYHMEPGISARSQLQQSGAILRKAESFAQVHTQPVVKSSSDRSIIPLLVAFLPFVSWLCQETRNWLVCIHWCFFHYLRIHCKINLQK